MSASVARAIPQLAEGKRRLLADARVLVLERGDECVDRARVTQLAEGVHGIFRTLGFVSLSAPVRGSTARLSRSWPSPMRRLLAHVG